ncbi:MAG: four helix bundle protein [Nanoarchaeota archaeon]
MARNFHDLEVWKLAYNLALDLYRITENFPKNEEVNLIQQIRRASVSIPLNIAEGCSRFSKRAFLQFLSYSYGSCRELEVLLMLSKDLAYVNNEEFKLLYEKLDKLSRKLFTFMTSINKEKFFNWFK